MSSPSSTWETTSMNYPGPSYSKNQKRNSQEYELLKIVKKEEDQVSYEETCKEGNYVNRFKRLYLDSEATNYVVCVECNDGELMRYVQGGTRKLIDHNKNHKPDTIEVDEENDESKQPSITKFITENVSPCDRDTIADKLAICCSYCSVRDRDFGTGMGFRI